MSLGRVSAGFCVVALLACNALTGVSDLTTGGGDDVGLPGNRSVDSGGADGAGGRDGSSTTSDGSGGADVVVDSSSDATSGGSFCSAFKNAAFCTDFEEPLPGAGWGRSTTNGATVDFSTANAHSPSHAVRAGVGSNTTTNRIAFYSRPISNAVVGHARLTYSLFVESRPTGAEIEVNGLVFDGADSASELYLAIDDTGASLAEQITPTGGAPTSNYFPLGAAIPTGQWVRVSLEVVLAGARSFLLQVDGKDVDSKPLTLPVAGAPIVRVGTTWAGKDAAAAVFFVDDVAFEILP